MAEPLHIHSEELGLDLTVQPLKQRQMEALNARFRELGNDSSTLSLSEYYGNHVRAAVHAGVLPQMDVDEMEPGAVLFIGVALARYESSLLFFQLAMRSPSQTTPNGQPESAETANESWSVPPS